MKTTEPCPTCGPIVSRVGYDCPECAEALQADSARAQALAADAQEITHHDDCWDARCRGC